MIAISIACSADSESPTTLEKANDDILTPLPDWKEFNVDGISIWLPDTCEGGSVDDYIDARVAKGSNREELTQIFNNNLNP